MSASSLFANAVRSKDLGNPVRSGKSAGKSAEPVVPNIPREPESAAVGDVEIMADFLITFILVISFIIVSLNGDVKRLAGDDEDGFISPFPGSTATFFASLSQDIICDSRIPRLVNTAVCQPYILGSSPSIPSLTHSLILPVVSMPVRTSLANEDWSGASVIPAIMVTPSETLGFVPTTVLESPSSRSTTPSSDRSSISRIPRLVKRSSVQNEVFTSTPRGRGSGARRATSHTLNTSMQSPTPIFTRICTTSPNLSQSASPAQSRTPPPHLHHGPSPTWNPLDGCYSPCDRCNHHHHLATPHICRIQHLSLQSRSSSPYKDNSPNSSGSTGGSTSTYTDANNSKDVSTSSTVLTDEEPIPGFADVVDKSDSEIMEMILVEREASASGYPNVTSAEEQELLAPSEPWTMPEDGFLFRDVNLMSMDSIIAKRDTILDCLASTQINDSLFSSDDKYDSNFEESEEEGGVGDGSDLITDTANDGQLLPIILDILAVRKEAIQHRRNTRAELGVCAQREAETYEYPNSSLGCKFQPWLAALLRESSSIVQHQSKTATRRNAQY
ncbi:hypothetical protein CONPUDRAFT_74348 [Coniophora puteana RWD-64-598 SS2]|uniref:Uncharacterized protein n=1 Tax=Coniophora puteana (strain RWD-64-598) TaxID=741705 RepID=A0A5M3MLI2_CONPW|nr:uncharacterized protein CONPUDRAFT_74348 [Coniophora puteana RWD-64-598 SS2]EIW80089.1 hypothetical protein CONPUDRAFT_74348 [Coniophora puteana RWD-64-598 SS2]